MRSVEAIPIFSLTRPDSARSPPSHLGIDLGELLTLNFTGLVINERTVGYQYTLGPNERDQLMEYFRNKEFPVKGIYNSVQVFDIERPLTALEKQRLETMFSRFSIPVILPQLTGRPIRGDGKVYVFDKLAGISGFIPEEISVGWDARILASTHGDEALIERLENDTGLKLDRVMPAFNRPLRASTPSPTPPPRQDGPGGSRGAEGGAQPTAPPFDLGRVKTERENDSE